MQLEERIFLVSKFVVRHHGATWANGIHPQNDMGTPRAIVSAFVQLLSLSLQPHCRSKKLTELTTAYPERAMETDLKGPVPWFVATQTSRILLSLAFVASFVGRHPVDSFDVTKIERAELLSTNSRDSSYGFQQQQPPSSPT